MQLDSFDLVTSLRALPETDPVEIDGIQFCGRGGGGGHGRTCSSSCDSVTANIVQTVCLIASTC